MSADDAPAVVDLVAVAQASATAGPTWSTQSEDMNVTLLVFADGDGVAAHVNTEVDVLLVGIAGAGVVEMDGVAHALRAGQALLIPKGARRAMRSVGTRFVYLSCHRQRAGLWPRGVPRPATCSDDHGQERPR